MNLALCEYAEGREFTAGNKARTDVVQILCREGYQHIPLYRSGASKLLVFFQLIAGCVKAWCLAGRGETVFIQYPYYPRFVNGILFAALRFGRLFRHYRIVVLLHDVVGLRQPMQEDLREESFPIVCKEVAWLNKLDMVICHNEKMKELLLRHGLGTQLLVLGLFDYLLKEYGRAARMSAERPDRYRICIAGNLMKEKAGYVYQLARISAVDFSLYGLGYAGDSDSHVQFEGVYPPEELPLFLKGDFGLVWDGDFIETCSGQYGRYLRYNDPHKFSLYLAAGKPVIVWKESALADFVREKEIGLCVDSLTELDHIFTNLDEGQYRRWLKNVETERGKVIAGGYLRGITKLL